MPNNLEQLLQGLVSQSAASLSRPSIGAGIAGSGRGVTSFNDRLSGFNQSAGPLLEALLKLQEGRRSALTELGLFRGLTQGLGGGVATR